jgi:hypothetical protein
MSIDEIYFMNQCSLVDKIAGLLDKLFSWKFCVPLSRLTYSIYLIHVTIIQAHVGSTMTPVYLSDYSMVSTSTVAFGSLIRPVVQVMTSRSKLCKVHSCSLSGSQSHEVSMSHLRWAK